MRLDLSFIEVDGQIAHVVAGVVEFAEFRPSGQEGLENCEARFHVWLAPFSAVGVPELQRGDSGARHLEVADEEDGAGFTVDVLVDVSRSKEDELGVRTSVPSPIPKICRMP